MFASKVLTESSEDDNLELFLSFFKKSSSEEKESYISFFWCAKKTENSNYYPIFHERWPSLARNYQVFTIHLGPIPQ